MDTVDPVVIVGDWNTSAGELDDLIAARIDGEVVVGRGPDHAVIRGVQHVRTRRLPKGRHADHHPILYKFRVEGEVVKVLAWNVHQGHPPAALAGRLEHLAARFHPDVFVLNEAYWHRKVLRRIGGYRRYQGLNIGEGADVALLVRRDRKVTHEGVVSMRSAWMVVRYARWRKARVYRRARIRLARGLHLRLLGIHAPTDAPVNTPARRESDDRIVSWANTKEK